MATSRICSVEGCIKTARARGMCAAHYSRMRCRGTIDPAQTPKGEPIRFLNDVVLPFRGDECLPWPYNKHERGYGQIWLNGKPARVTRVICTKIYGAPERGLHAAHNCGNPICCNPNHLRWATISDNQMDRVAHDTHQRGERHPNHIVTEKDVRAIKSLRGHVSQKELAERFGITKWQVGKIQRGIAWSWLE